MGKAETLDFFNHINKNDFFEKVRANEFHHLKGNKSTVEKILSLDLFFGFIEESCYNISVPSIQMVKNGKYTSIEELTYQHLSQGKFCETRYSYQAIKERLQANHSLIFRGIQHSFSTLKEIALCFGEEVGCKTNVNSYYTPSNSTGLLKHYDTHAIVALQIHGSKIWKISKPSIINPIKSKQFKSSNFETPQKVDYEIETKTGDLLFLPRGYWHSVSTSNLNSLHLTVGIHKKTNLDFLMWLASKEEFLREDLGYDKNDDHLSQGLSKMMLNFKRKKMELLSEFNDSDL